MPAKAASPTQVRCTALEYEKDWPNTLEDLIRENGGSALVTDRMGVEVRPLDENVAGEEHLREDQFPLKILFAPAPGTAPSNEETSPTSNGKMSDEIHSDGDKNLPTLGTQTSGGILYTDVWPGILATKMVQAAGAHFCLEDSRCTLIVTDACGVQIDLNDTYLPEESRFPLKLHFKACTNQRTRQTLGLTAGMAPTTGGDEVVGYLSSAASCKPGWEQYTVEVSHKSLLADVVNFKLQEMCIPTDAENRPMVLITDHTGVQVCRGVPDRSKFPLKYYIENSSMDQSTLQDIKKAWWKKLQRAGNKEGNTSKNRNVFMRSLSHLSSVLGEDMSPPLRA